MEKKTVRILSLCAAALMAGMAVFYFINTFGRVFMWAPYALLVLLALVLAAFPAPRKLRLLFLLPGALLLYTDFRQLIGLIRVVLDQGLGFVLGTEQLFRTYLFQIITDGLSVLSALLFLLFLLLRAFNREKGGRAVPALWCLPAILSIPQLGSADALWELPFCFGFCCLCYVLFAGEGTDRAPSPAGGAGVPGTKALRVFSLCAAALLLPSALEVYQTSAAADPRMGAPSPLPYFLLLGCALLVCFLPAQRKLRLVFLIPGALLAAQYYQEFDTFFQNWGRALDHVMFFQWYPVISSGTCFLSMALFLIWIVLRSFGKGKAGRLVSTLWFLPGVVIFAYGLYWEDLCLILGLRFLCCALFAGTDAPHAVPATVPADPVPPAPVDPAPAAETPSSAPETEAAPSGALFCPRCGRPLTTDAAFCPHCGGRVEQD